MYNNCKTFVRMKTLNVELIENIYGWGFNFSSLNHQLKDFSGELIYVPINSNGGDVLEGWAMFNLLTGHKAKVKTHIAGNALSMGTVLAMAGDVVTMAENGYFMIHNPTTWADGDHRLMEGQADVLKTMTEDIANAYVNKTGLPLNQILDMMGKETWLNGKQALEMGFVDELTKGAKLVASYNPSIYKNCKNTPTDIMAKFENGEKLGDFINAEIDKKVEADEMERSAVLELLSNAADRSVDTIRSILNGTIDCPPVEVLEAFSTVLDVTNEQLIDAGVADGCKYGDDDDESEVIENNETEVIENSGKNKSIMNKVITFLNQKFGLNIDKNSDQENIIAAVESANIPSDESIKASIKNSVSKEIESMNTTLNSLKGMIENHNDLLIKLGEKPGDTSTVNLKKVEENTNDIKSDDLDGDHQKWNQFVDNLKG